jgi:hypothetical protein
MEPTVERLLLAQLLDAWVQHNWSLFGQRMSPPGLVVEEMSALGRWERRARRIAISRRLVAHATWIEVLEVLKHEMAHQFVDEILRVTDEAAHGETFREVCRARAIDPRAASPAPAVEASDAISERVRRLLALADRGTEHEAHVALQSAMRLMARHGIQPTPPRQEPTWAVRQIDTVHARWPSHLTTLIGALSRHLGCPTLWVRGMDVTRGKPGTAVEAVGRAETLDLLEHMYVFVRRAVERQWVEHRRHHPRVGDRDRRSFLLGAVMGFARTLDREAVALREEGLVWVRDPAIDELHGRRHPRVTRRGGASYVLNEAHAAGREAGARIQVREALRGGPGPRLLSGD